VSFVVLRLPPALPATELPVMGGGLFPVRRIYRVGLNYVDHIRTVVPGDLISATIDGLPSLPITSPEA
jgi:fumarylpyruvate hydrolase